MLNDAHNSSSIQARLNTLAQAKIPFLFIIDFELTRFYIELLDNLHKELFFSFDGVSHPIHPKPRFYPTLRIKNPVRFTRYVQAFERVIHEMREGNTYLLNLTFPTEIELTHSLFDIYAASAAPFKLFFKDQFVVFSPERFVKIENGIIKTFPMKGTIDAALPNARQRILTDPKEQAEHTMVVDLLRNDLGIVARHIRVQRFRYVDKIKAGQRELLQVSSEISGVLPPDWAQHLGDILVSLLPAGSISGTPKRKTLEIIKTVEGYQRGFFTGIFGYFDGQQVDSAVMIRFIERVGHQFFYKSGGGITIDSTAESEYQEMLAKVYIPVMESKS